jgi:uncharacterized protein (DUF983 family)
MPEKRVSRSYLSSALTCRCPRCREGKLFQKPLSINLKGIMKMNETCPVCGQDTQIEVGFYYGTAYVSYAITVAFSLATLVFWWLLIGFSTTDKRFLSWVITNAFMLVILQPWFMRLSRSLWISWFVKYEPDWEHKKPENTKERLNAEQSNNW